MVLIFLVGRKGDANREGYSRRKNWLVLTSRERKVEEKREEGGTEEKEER